jgi:hypothetical protein
MEAGRWPSASLRSVLTTLPYLPTVIPSISRTPVIKRSAKKNPIFNLHTTKTEIEKKLPHLVKKRKNFGGFAIRLILHRHVLLDLTVQLHIFLLQLRKNAVSKISNISEIGIRVPKINFYCKLRTSANLARSKSRSRSRPGITRARTTSPGCKSARQRSGPGVSPRCLRARASVTTRCKMSTFFCTSYCSNSLFVLVFFFLNNFFWSSSFCVFENVTYDDVRFDKVRNGVEDAFGAVRLLLAPERKTFGKIFVTRYPKSKKKEKVVRLRLLQGKEERYGRPLVRGTLDRKLKSRIKLSPSFARCCRVDGCFLRCHDPSW